MTTTVLFLHNTPERNNEFSFSTQNFESSLFSSKEECILSLLEYCLTQNWRLIHIKGISSVLGKHLDNAFGQGFHYKFKYANTPFPKLVAKFLEKFQDKTAFLDKLIFLVVPFHKITYDSSLQLKYSTNHLPFSSSHEKVIFSVEDFNSNEDYSEPLVFEISHPTNPEVEQFFQSKNFIQSLGWTDCFIPGDISFFSDASCNMETTLAGAAIQNNHLICAFRKTIALEDNNLSELRAIYETIELALSMSLDTLLLYTDNSNAIDFISGKSKLTIKNTPFFELANQINTLLKSFKSYHIAWIPRKKNFIADNLSKQDFNGDFYNR